MSSSLSTFIKAAAVSFILAIAAGSAHAQINPNQIDWPTGASGCVYAPATNTCVSAGGGGGGTVTYTSSHTAGSADAGKLVVMNCSSACALTLPGTQPSSTWYAGVTTQGSTVATITLGGGDTFNGSSSVPILNTFDILWVFADSGTSTNYAGQAPLVAGANVTLTPASNGLSLAATATSSLAFSALTGSTNTTAAMVIGSGASMGHTGTGSIDATKVNGVATTGTPSSGQVCSATSSTNCTWTAPAAGVVYESRVANSSETEYVSCAAGAVCQLASISGAGTMVSLDLDVQSSHCNASMIDIIADGNVVLAAPVGLVFGVFGQGPCGSGTAQTFGSPKLSLNNAVAGTSYGGRINWIISYSSSLVVDFIQDPGGSASDTFSNVDYFAGAAPAGLYPAQYAHFNSWWAFQTIAQYATMNWLPSFANGPGALESLQWYASASNTGFIEGDPSITADGGSYLYNGTEDLFCGSFGFAGLKGNIQGSCGSAFVGTTNMGAFRFFDLWPIGTDNRPIPFATSLALAWPNGSSGQGSAPGVATAQSLVTWYTTNAEVTPTYTGGNCNSFTSASSSSQTCVLSVVSAGDVVAGAVALTALSSATATCGTMNTIRTIPWASGAVELVVFDIPNATAGSCTITFNYSSQNNVSSMAIDVGGANISSPIDNTNCASTPFCSTTGSGSSISSPASITTSGTNELVVGFGVFGSSCTLSAASLNYLSSASACDAVTIQPAFSAASTSTNYTNSGGSGNWVSSTIAIKH